jgi:hypothetical protein
LNLSPDEQRCDVHTYQHLLLRQQFTLLRWDRLISCQCFFPCLPVV